jgi:hypothetical protein
MGVMNRVQNSNTLQRSLPSSSLSPSSPSLLPTVSVVSENASQERMIESESRRGAEGVQEGLSGISHEEFRVTHPQLYYSLPSSPTLVDICLSPLSGVSAYLRRLVFCFTFEFVSMCFSAYLLKGALYKVLDISLVSLTLFSIFYSAFLSGREFILPF